MQSKPLNQTPTKPRKVDKKYIVIDAPDIAKDKDSVAALHVLCLLTGQHKFLKALNYHYRGKQEELEREAIINQHLTNSIWTVKMLHCEPLTRVPLKLSSG